MTHTPARLRLRRRLLIYSAPLTVIAVLVIIKLISVVVAGNSAVSDFARGDGDAVQTDAAILGVVNVVEPSNAPFAAGTAAVLDGRLDDADRLFAEALAISDSCPVRVNLELVQEAQGDIAAAAGDLTRADERYASALAVVGDTPPECFSVDNDAANRLAAKISALTEPIPAAPPPVPPPVAPPPPPPPLPVAITPDGREIPPRELDPAGGDPLDKLLQILQDAAGAVPR